MTEASKRKQLIRYSHRMYQAGWVANHDGNLTARLGGEKLLCTPTAVSKGDVEPSWLIVVDGENNVVEGTRRSFSEMQLHRAAYEARPDISVVIHAHPPVSCGFAVAGVPLPHPMMLRLYYLPINRLNKLRIRSKKPFPVVYYYQKKMIIHFVPWVKN